MTTRERVLTCVYTVCCAAFFLVLALPLHCSAADDDGPPGRVARLSYVRGSISFEPAGAPDWAVAVINRPLTSGDKLWVDSDSRAEVQIGSSTIHLNSRTGFSFLNLDDRTVQIQLSAGTLGLTVRHLDRNEVFEVDTSNQAFSILQPGHYRLYASDDGNTTIVNVREGQGESIGAGRSYAIQSQQAITLTGTDSLNVDVESAGGHDRDDFDEWCASRDSREAQSASRRYVSPEVVGYQDLDDNGVWRYDLGYGEVWVPIAIPVGWAPYHFGHWSWISPWGWTWVDDAPWGYATSHYGRWVYTQHTWCWVPGPASIRPVYAPALVAFVGGSNFSVGMSVGDPSLVGWFPLGPREVYVPGYQVSSAYVNRVNISNTTVSTTTVTNVYNTTLSNDVNTTQVLKITYRNSSAPGAITAVPQTSFASGQPVALTAVAVNQHQIPAAGVTMRAHVAPTSASLVGPAVATNNRIVAPPAAVLTRSVVAKVAPPPPAVPFERQQAALAEHPGEPLARNEVESLRPANIPGAHPVTAPLSVETQGNEPKGQLNLQVGDAQPSSPELVGRPVSATSPEQQKRPLTNAAASVFPSYAAPTTNQASHLPNSGPAHDQSSTQPIREQVSYRSAPSENGPTAQPSNSRSVQPAPAFPGPLVISPAKASGNVGNLQPAENKVQAASPVPAAPDGDKEKEKNK